MTINLKGVRIPLDLRGGHKTGYYLDQQVKYRLVGELARGARVLDCFCILAGFTLHAGRAGAERVHGLDQSAEAMASAQKNVGANGLADKCTFEATNVFDWLKAQTTVGPHEKVVPRRFGELRPSI